MKGFIKNILERHTSQKENTRPRLPGKFEPAKRETAGFSIIREAEPVPVSGAATEKNKFQPGIKNTVIAKQEKINTEDRRPPLIKQLPLKTPVNPELQKNTKQDEGKNRSADKGEKSKTALTKIAEPKVRENIIDPETVKQMMKIIKKENADKSSEINSARQNQVVPAVKIRTSERDKNLMPLVNGKTSEYNNMLSRMRALELNQQSKPPVIKISIGRIEVRAVTGVTQSSMIHEKVQKPKLSLDEYLTKRNSAKS